MLTGSQLADLSDCQAYLAALPLGLQAMQNVVQGAGNCVQAQVLDAYISLLAIDTS